MKKLGIIFGLFLFLMNAHPVTSGALDSWYSDVPDSYAYYDGIFYMTQAEYVSGYEDGTFKPENEVSRVEALKMILSVAEVESVDTSTVSVAFTDMDPGAWYDEYIRLALIFDIISGHPDGSFKPEDTVNRAEALKMLLIATGTVVPEEPENEEEGSIWYELFMEYAKEHALIWPDSSGDYLPGATLTRGELADLIYRFKKEPYTTQVEYGIASYYGYSFDGHNTASGTPLDAYGTMAAHKTLPFGTIVRITNLDNMKTVDVEVVDRGPYTEGYIIDLTPGAFEQIGSLSTGILNVRLEVLK